MRGGRPSGMGPCKPAALQQKATLGLCNSTALGTHCQLADQQPRSEAFQDMQCLRELTLLSMHVLIKHACTHKALPLQQEQQELQQQQQQQRPTMGRWLTRLICPLFTKAAQHAAPGLGVGTRLACQPALSVPLRCTPTQLSLLPCMQGMRCSWTPNYMLCSDLAWLRACLASQAL